MNSSATVTGCDDIIKRIREGLSTVSLVTNDDDMWRVRIGDIRALLDRLDAAERHILALEGGLDAVLEFASTVAGSSSWWDEEWPEHSSAIDAAMAAEQSDERSEK